MKEMNCESTIFKHENIICQND